MADLPTLIELHLNAALGSSNGRSAELILHDGPLRQSILAIRAGVELGEHNSPDAASIQVLRGRVRVTAQDNDELGAGGIALLTHERHAVKALEDSVFLLTTVTGVGQGGGPERAR